MNQHEYNDLPAVLHDPENGLIYLLQGDCYLPILCIDEQTAPLGRWGWLRLYHLMNNHAGRYSYLLLSGKLYPHLHETEKQAGNRFDALMEQYRQTLGITEELKASDQMRRVQLMNTARHDAEDIIMNELILDEGGVHDDD